jgi:hypothetical protein
LEHSTWAFASNRPT